MQFLMHFGLKHPPFHKSQQVLWDNESLNQLTAKFTRLLDLPGVGVLTGDYGVGKTSALRHIQQQVQNPNCHQFIYICETGFSRTELYRLIARALGVELSHRRSDLWYNIKHHLQTLKQQRHVLPIIIIDEAQALSAEFLDDLASFLNFQYDAEDMLTLWLVGNKALASKLKQSRFEALNSRVRIWHELQRINKFEDFTTFIDHGFKSAGCTTRLLADSDLRVLMEATQCLPRHIYNVVTNCLEIAYARNLNHISSDILEEVLESMR